MQLSISDQLTLGSTEVVVLILIMLTPNVERRGVRILGSHSVFSHALVLSLV